MITSPAVHPGASFLTFIRLCRKVLYNPKEVSDEPSIQVVVLSIFTEGLKGEIYRLIKKPSADKISELVSDILMEN